MLKTIAILVAVLIVLYAAAIITGSWRWQQQTRLLLSRIEADRLPPQTARVDFNELAGLPAPVQRYFRLVLQQGQPIITGVSVRHTGSFNMGQNADQWKPFSSSQQVVTRRPGFVWNARIAMMPGIGVHVHDAYAGGEGILHAALLGLVTVADLRDSDEVARGELMRYFAEAAWYPTALLPSQGVAWEAVDDRSATATLVDRQVRLTMQFHFNDKGLIDTIRAESRGRTVGKQVIPTPWQGRFWNYRQQQGMLVPLNGEVMWLLPQGPKPYWRGEITAARYEFAG